METDIKKKLTEALKNTPVIDSHSHIPAEDGMGKDALAAYTGQYLGHDLITAGMPEADYRKLSNQGIPASERLKLLPAWLEKIKLTGYYRCAARSAGAALGVGVTPFTAETLAEAQAAYRRSHQPGYYEKLFAANFIKGVVVDNTGFDWRHGGVCAQSYNTIHLFAPYNNELLEKISAFSGVNVRGFDSYVHACKEVIRKKVSEQGARVLKFPIAYTRELSFPLCPRGEAEDEFNRVYAARITYRDAISPGFGFDQCPRFQNYLMHQIMGEADSLGLVCQFHTGMLAGHRNYLPNARPSGLIPLIFKYPGVRFDLFHMAFPYQGELGVIAKNYPNVYVNLCWAHIISPEAVTNALSELLELLPRNKIIGFGSDVSEVDLVLGGLSMAKENIAGALARKVHRGLIDLDEACELAENLLYNNPKTLYYA